jgi:hypothetical protein
MNILPLLTFIGKYESKNNFDAIWGGIKSVHRPKKPISQLTIREVLAWQDSIDPFYMSEAAGCWQFMEDTLRGLHIEAKVSLDAKMNEDTQTTLAIALLRRRGLTRYLKGEISAETFANNIAKEWASMPVVTPMKRGSVSVKPGQSYYAGDGLNKAHASVEDFLAVVRRVRMSEPLPAPATVEKKPVEKVVTSEAGRILRHVLTPAAVVLVGAGYLPEAISGPLIDTIVIGVTFVGSLIWSKFAAKKA